MNDSMMLFISLIALACLAIIVLGYVFRQDKRLLAILLVVFIGFITSTYYHWGNSQSLIAHHQKQLNQQRVKKALAEFSGPNEIIERLKARLVKEPTSSKGWYLLGRLYMSQGKAMMALSAFDKALDLRPDDLTISLNFVEACYAANASTHLDKADKLIEKILKKNPMQQDALSLSAVRAFQQKKYAVAIKKWQKLLPLLPANSSHEKTIKEAIMSAKSKLKKSES
jgi:cytochrome c-type biogenesis protein CcmH